MCRELKKDDLVSHCWLSQSIGKDFLESVEYEKSGDWEVKQCAGRKPYKRKTIDFDPDIIKTPLTDIGF